MAINRNRLYILLGTLIPAGYVWILAETVSMTGRNLTPDFCIFHRVTGLPCPSCGSTRSVISAFGGDIPGALYTNPFGIIIALIMTVVPVWLVYDLVLRKQTFYDFYRLAERTISKPPVAVFLVILVLANWAWNISKGI